MKKNVANNVDRVSFIGKITKWPVQKQTLRPARKRITTRRYKHLE